MSNLPLRRKARAAAALALLTAVVAAGCGESGGTADDGTEQTSDDAGYTCPADYPDHEIELIVPFSAGGSIDSAARTVGRFWTDRLGVPVTVTNVEGAGGMQGFSQMFRDDDNGHRILVAVEPYLSVAVLRGSDYAFDDFAPINVQEFDPVTITVRADSEYQTLQDLIADSRERPGEISYSTVPGGAIQLVPRMLAAELGVEWREVTYDGGEETRSAVLSGEVDFATSTTAGDLALGEEVRVLGMATTDPGAAVEHLPTINDALADESVELPNLGSTRFFATKTAFKNACPDQFQLLVDTYQETLEDPAFLEAVGSTADRITYYGPDESEQLMAEMFEVAQQNEDILLNE